MPCLSLGSSFCGVLLFWYSLVFRLFRCCSLFRWCAIALAVFRCSTSVPCSVVLCSIVPGFMVCPFSMKMMKYKVETRISVAWINCYIKTKLCLIRKLQTFQPILAKQTFLADCPPPQPTHKPPPPPPKKTKKNQLFLVSMWQQLGRLMS